MTFHFEIDFWVFSLDVAITVSWAMLGLIVVALLIVLIPIIRNYLGG